MSLYTKYMEEIQTRKTELGLNPQPIDSAELVSEIINQIKDTNNEHRKDSLHFFIFNTLPGTTSAAGVKAQFSKRNHSWVKSKLQRSLQNSHLSCFHT